MEFTPDSKKQPLGIDSLGLSGRAREIRSDFPYYDQDEWRRDYDIANNKNALDESEWRGVQGRLQGVTHGLRSPEYENLTKDMKQLPFWAEEQPKVTMLFSTLGPRAATATVGHMANDARKITGQLPKPDDTLSSYGAALSQHLTGDKQHEANWNDFVTPSIRVAKNRFKMREAVAHGEPGIQDISPEELDTGFNNVMQEVASKRNTRPVQVRPQGRNTQDFKTGNSQQGELPL